MKRGGQDATGAVADTDAVDVVVSVVIDVLVDGALLEVFGNRRAAISSFITEVMQEQTTIAVPQDRVVFAAPVPAGVTCTYATHGLTPLL